MWVTWRSVNHFNVIMHLSVPEIPPWGQTFAEFLTQPNRTCLLFWVLTKTWGFPPSFPVFFFQGLATAPACFSWHWAFPLLLWSWPLTPPVMLFTSLLVDIHCWTHQPRSNGLVFLFFPLSTLLACAYPVIFLLDSKKLVFSLFHICF